MSLDTRSFLLGMATVSGLVIVGFGGGILMGGVLTGDDRTPNKIERHAVAKGEAPVQPAPVQPANVVAPAKPVPLVEPTPVVTAMPAEATPSTDAPAPPPVLRGGTAPLPFAQQQTAQPGPAPASAEQKPAVAATETKRAAASQQPALGPERPVALTGQDDRARPLSRLEEARMRREQRRAERELRREERRRLMAEYRERDQLRRQQTRADRLKREDFDDDDDQMGERTVLREHTAPRAPDLPFFRIFGGD